MPNVGFDDALRYYGGVAEWLRRSISNHTRSTHLESNPLVGATNHKRADNSAVHTSEVGK